jgi:hypothetical protein
MRMKKNKILKVLIAIGTIGILAIVGYFGYQYFLAPKSQPVVNQSTQKPTDETASWPTYKNDEFGFSVKYPEGWQKKEEDETHIIFSNQSDHSDNIYLSIDEESLESVLEKGFGGPVRNVKEEDIVINGKKAHRISADFLIEDIGQGEKWSSKPSVFTYIANSVNNRTFVISTDSSNRATYEELLSTLSIEQ